MAASGLDLKRGRGGAIHRVTHEGQQRTPARLATLGLLTQATVPPRAVRSAATLSARRASRILAQRQQARSRAVNGQPTRVLASTNRRSDQVSVDEVERIVSKHGPLHRKHRRVDGASNA